MLTNPLELYGKLEVNNIGVECDILADDVITYKLGDDFDGDIINHTIILAEVTNLTITKGVPDEWRERKQPLTTTEDLLDTFEGILRYPTLEYDKEHNGEKEATTVL